MVGFLCGQLTSWNLTPSLCQCNLNGSVPVTVAVWIPNIELEVRVAIDAAGGRGPQNGRDTCLLSVPLARKCEEFEFVLASHKYFCSSRLRQLPFVQKIFM